MNAFQFSWNFYCILKLFAEVGKYCLSYWKAVIKFGYIHGFGVPIVLLCCAYFCFLCWYKNLVFLLLNGVLSCEKISKLDSFIWYNIFVDSWCQKLRLYALHFHFRLWLLSWRLSLRRWSLKLQRNVKTQKPRLVYLVHLSCSIRVEILGTIRLCSSVNHLLKGT